MICISTNELPVWLMSPAIRKHLYPSVFSSLILQGLSIFVFHSLLFRYGLPAERLWISVFEDDNEAFDIWHNEVSYLKFINVFNHISQSRLGV